MDQLFVILTHKPGHFRTELCEGLEPVEQFDYHFANRKLASFVIARLLHPVRVALVEEEPPYTRNCVPSKFLPQFASLEAAREELQQLVSFGHLDTRLQRVFSEVPEAL
jgi:hypothetical protein